jgi:signal transduction histidine kinase
MREATSIEPVAEAYEQLTSEAAYPASSHAVVQSQRLEAMGRLTGGVAHDFNNLLTVIMGITESLAADLDAGSEHQKLAITGLRAAERGANLVRRLLASSRDDARNPTMIDCGEKAWVIAELVRHTIRDDVELTVSRPAYPLSCIADRTDLTSALLNLCMNARDAMPLGGELSLDVDSVLLSVKAAQPFGLQPGPYVVFTVRDNGVGMSPATLRQATEPFFTTKGEAGTGLGLATSHAFARESGGHLAISSREGRGTSVALYLPRARAPRLVNASSKICALEAHYGF